MKHYISRLRLYFVLLISAVPIFLNFSKSNIQLWDESRLAHNAYEMYRTGNYLVATYIYGPDMWNTKPPFLLWMQVLSFKIFGVSEFALRLPSALAGLATCMLLFWFFAKKIRRPNLGVLAVVILVSCNGFVKYHHSVRTGDYDAMLTFFTTFFTIAFYLFIEEEKRKYLRYALLGIILAVFTKTIAGLLFLPALFIYAIYRNKLLLVLKSKDLYIGIALFAVLVGGFYLLREHYNPGYLDAVKENDLGGRFASYQEHNDEYLHDNYFYYDLIAKEHFRYWFLFMFAGIPLGIFASKKLRDLTVFSLLLSLDLFIILSAAVNKKDWYDMPYFPYLSILAAIGIKIMYDFIVHTQPQKQWLNKRVLPFAFLIAISFSAYAKIVELSYASDSGDWIRPSTDMCQTLRSLRYDFNKGRKATLVINAEYAADVLWYQAVINDESDRVKMLHFAQGEEYVGKNVTVYQPGVKEFIEREYFYEKLEEYSNVILYHVKALRLPVFPEHVAYDNL